jgi:major membrane immunogen (membrane-anchored lipoprotein)
VIKLIIHMSTFQKPLILVMTGLVVTMTACTHAWEQRMPMNNGNYMPYVRLEGDERRKYEADVEVCQKKILKQYGDKYVSNNAITDLRHCLILKGYVLLS